MDLQQRLATILCAATGLSPEDLDPDASFLELGLSSIALVDAFQAVRSQLGVRPSLREVFASHRTLRRLTAYIGALMEAGTTEPDLDWAPESTWPGVAIPMPAALGHRWFLARYSDEAAAAWQETVAVRLDGPVDVPGLAAAVRRVVTRHGALRARLHPEQDALMVPEEGAGEGLQHVAVPPGELRRALASTVGAPLDLARGAAGFRLLSAAPGGPHLLVVQAHAVVADRAGLGCALQEVLALYADQDTPMPVPLAFAHAIARLGASAGERAAAELAGFVQTLRPVPPPLDLPTDHPRPAVKTYVGARVVLPVPRETTGVLDAAARRCGVPTSVLVLTAWAVLLSRLGRTPRFLLGVQDRADVLSGASGAVVAPLGRTLPVAVAVPRDALLKGCVSSLATALAGVFDRPTVSMAQLMEALNQTRDQSRSGLFVAAFATQLEPDWPDVDGVVVSLLVPPNPWARVDLSLCWSQSSAGSGLILDYSTELFQRATVVAWLKELARALAGMRDALEGTVGAWIAGAPGPPVAPRPALGSTRSALVRFDDHAAATPRAPAVMHRDGVVDYATLQARSVDVAAALSDLGVRPGDRVGLSMDRGPELVAVVMGIWRAGAAYVPLDPSYPEAWLRATAADARLARVITDHPMDWGLPISAPETLSGRSRSSARAVGGTDCAYVIYTSGSTGQPKGVVVEHRQVSALLGWAHEVFSAAELGVMLASTSLSFDLSVFEFWAPLTAGGCLLLVRDGLDVAEHPRADQITFVNMVPSVAVELARLGAFPTSARVVALAGEALRAAMVAAIRRAVAPDTRVFNLYGPTECTVYATWLEIDPGAADEPSIGRPLPGLEARVVDAYGVEVPPRTPGELYLLGDLVARGYHDRPALTAERFAADPRDPSRRGFRTGDVVRWGHAGQLEFLGRRDRQVKLRGFRVELGEIESTLLALGASEAAVVVRGDRLWAFVVGMDGQPGGPAALVDALRSRLPAHMVPTLASLPRLPRLPNGKLDRAALPQGPAEPSSPERTALGTPTERALADIWCALLEVPTVTAASDFFELGGHSLLMTALLVELRRHFGVRPKLRAMFDTPRLAGLAAHIDALMAPGGAPEDDPDAVRRRFARLEQDASAPGFPGLPGDAVDLGVPATHVLLTGATGFVGAHILHALLERSDARITCWVRGAPDAVRGRVEAALRRHGLSWSEAQAARVRVRPADLTAPGFGVDAAELASLAVSVDRVLHSAAQVNFVYPYDALHQTNVGGVLALIRFAMTGRLKPLHFVSTAAVWPMGAHLAFAEDDSIDHGQRLNLGYDESKWVAERLLARAAQAGLPAFVYRPGEVAGHSRTGRGVVDHFAVALVRGSLDIGAMPPFYGLVDLSPVDYVAEAIAVLVAGPAPAHRTFHLTNPHPMEAREVFQVLRDMGYRFDLPEFSTWRRRLLAHPELANNALYPYLPILEDFDPVNLQFPRYGSGRAVSALTPLGVRCPPLSAALLRRYIEYFQDIGYMPRP